MDFARYWNSRKGIWSQVAAEGDYNPAVHGKDLICSDSECDAAMYHAPAKEGMSGGIEVPAYFGSYRRHAHREGCGALRKSYAIASNSVALRMAITEGYPIIASVLFDVGHPDYHRYRTMQEADKARNEYNRFRMENIHGRESVHSLQELLDFIAKVEKMKPGVSEQIMVAHAGRVCSLKHVMIMDDDKALRQLYIAGERKEPRGDGFVYGFPRVVMLQLTKREMAERGFSQGRVNCSPEVLSEYDRKSFILLNSVSFSGEGLRQDFLGHDQHLVFAVPRIKSAQAIIQREAFEKAECYFATYTQQEWHVVSDAQIVPAPGAQILELKKAGKGPQETQHKIGDNITVTVVAEAGEPVKFEDEEPASPVPVPVRQKHLFDISQPAEPKFF